MRGPNAEQKKAIEHHGGVLLSAGAGSGKTFVLVEHVIYLAGEKLREFSTKSLEEKGKLLKNEFSRFVLMTYTKKAAGELSVRLKTRVEGLIEEGEDPEGWRLISQCLDSMYVGTIHGFCFRLLGQGFFPNIHADIKLIDETDFKSRIGDLYERWLETKQEKLKSRGEDIYELFLLAERDIVDSLCSIMGDPELRTMWSDSGAKISPLEDFRHVITKTAKLLGVEDILKGFKDLNAWDEHKKKTWYLYLEAFQDWVREFHQAETSAEDQSKALEEFLAKVAELKARKPTGKSVSVEAVEYYVDVKSLVDFLKKHNDSLLAYIGEAREICQKYYLSFDELVSFVERRYDSSAEMTFSDLEYNVLKGLESSEVRQNIANSYNYFIVDEFQDTSETQYQILRQLISDDFGKLFCVGDVKQAIYGFRGGEVAVFERCMTQIPLNLSLKNNYRSLPHIIEFNNSLFEFLFSRGLEYGESQDEHSVAVERQSVPEKEEETSQGSLIKRIVNIDPGEDKKSLRPVEIDFVEAHGILNQIQHYFEQGETEVCVLYKNLRPSLYLLQDLLSKSLSFQAQVKVPYGEDPLIEAFFHCLEYAVEKESPGKHSEKIYDSIAEILALTFKFFDLNLSREDLRERLEIFSQDYTLWGISAAFYRFIYSLGLSNSNYDQNFKMIDSLIEVNGDDLSETLTHLREYLGDKYSIEFHSGDELKRVTMMTAHGSKGLQFANVILGGIHTNGRARGAENDFGKYPKSFKWKESPGQKKKYQTPAMLIELEVTRRKDFSESKRLFYVACTRAMKSLSWMDLWLQNSKPLVYGKNSWVHGIREFENMTLSGHEMELAEVIKEGVLTQECSLEDLEAKGGVQTNSPPLFHRDRLGVFARPDESSRLGVIPDLSVTRLALITQCPRKFFLRNICQFSDEELSVISDSNSSNKDSEDFEKHLEAPLDLADEENELSQVMEEKGSSSAERGIVVHEELSKYFNSNLTAPLKSSLPEMGEIFDWVKSQYERSLSQHSDDVQVISEEALKFPLFGYMISGIPDLVLHSSKRIEVWDFKTGKPSEVKEKPYWFQLKAYGHALYEKSLNSSENVEIVLKLLYVDVKEEKSLTVPYTQLLNELNREWQKLNNLSQMNTQHCRSCQFGNLCHPKV